MEKLCECGCGGLAPIATTNWKKWGYVKGQPVRFIRGHYFKLHRTLGPDHPNWKGDDASSESIHQWLNRHHPKKGACSDCGKEGKTEYANLKGHKWTRNIDDYRELCRACHLSFDWKGVPKTPQQRQRMRQAKLGKPRSEETKAKISAGVRRSLERRRALEASA